MLFTFGAIFFVVMFDSDHFDAIGEAWLFPAAINADDVVGGAAILVALAGLAGIGAGIWRYKYPRRGLWPMVLLGGFAVLLGLGPAFFGAGDRDEDIDEDVKDRLDSIADGLMNRYGEDAGRAGAPGGARPSKPLVDSLNSLYESVAKVDDLGIAVRLLGDARDGQQTSALKKLDDYRQDQINCLQQEMDKFIELWSNEPGLRELQPKDTISLIDELIALKAFSDDVPAGGPLWPVVLALLAFLYLWWLATLIFNMTVIWHWYVRNEESQRYLKRIAGIRAKSTGSAAS